MAYMNSLPVFYQGYENTQGTNIETVIKLSTVSNLECFWGVTVKIPVGKISDSGEVMITRSEKDVIELIMTYLKEISKPFPILLEKIRYLNLHFHGNWEEAVIGQKLYPENEIYFCDHKH